VGSEARRPGGIGGGGERRGISRLLSTILFCPHNQCSGESHPELCAQRTAEAEDFLITFCEWVRRGPTVSFVLSLCPHTYPFGVKDL